MAEERGLTVDIEGFNVAMDAARERSRSAQNKVLAVGLVLDICINLYWCMSSDRSPENLFFFNKYIYIFWQNTSGAIVMDADATAALHKKGIAVTNDIFKFTWFQVCLLKAT